METLTTKEEAIISILEDRNPITLSMAEEYVGLKYDIDDMTEEEYLECTARAHAKLSLMYANAFYEELKAWTPA